MARRRTPSFGHKGTHCASHRRWFSIAIAVLCTGVCVLGHASASLSCGLPNAVPQEERSNISIQGLEIPFGIGPLAWTSARLTANVANFLISEVLGINTAVLPDFSSSLVGFYSVSGCETPSNSLDRGCGRRFSEAHAVFESWATSVTPALYAQLAAELGDSVAENLGDLGYFGREALFVPTEPKDAAFDAEGLPLEYFRSFNALWHNPRQYFDSYSSIDTTGLLPCSMTRFGNSNLMQTYVQVTGDAAGVEFINGSMVGKCEGGIEGFWWFSPACRDDPETCIPVIDSGDGWFVDAFMMRAVKFNMPLAITVGEWDKYVSQPQSTKMMFYWFHPDTTFLDLRPSSIIFPAHDLLAHAAGDKSTDSEKVSLNKYVHFEVSRVASRAHDLIQDMQLTLAQLEPMMVEARLNPSKSEAEIACDWLLRNPEIWQPWVPVATKCAQGWGLIDSIGGYVEARSRAVSCDWCAPGRFSEQISDDDGDTYVCRLCGIGTHQDSHGKTSCLECVAGTFADEVGRSVCQSCLPGTASTEAGRSACDKCAPGSFQTEAGATACAPCASGTFTASGTSTDCEKCPVGMFSTGGATICEQCPSGFVSAVEGSSNCSACSAGHFAKDVGMSGCIACPIGQYANGSGRSSCEQCGGGAPLWTTMRRLTVKGEQQWVTTDAAKSERACGCDVGARFNVNRTCVECAVEGIDCVGMGEVMLLPGFYSEASPLSVFQCKSSWNCIGGPPGAVCAEGRVGLSCSKCEEGLRSDAAGACVPCSGGDHALLTVTVIVAATMIIVLYAVMERRGSGEPGYATMLIAISGGLLIGLMQQMSVMGFLDIRYAEPLHTFLGIAKIFAFDIDDMIRLNCIGSVPAIVHFTAKLSLIFASAIILLLVHVLFVLIKYRGRFRQQNPTLVAVFGNIVMIFYISVTLTILQPLQCTSNPNEVWTIQAYESTICWDPEKDGDHVVMLCIGLVALVIPISLFAKVISLVRRLPAALRHSNIGFIRSYSFLFFRFRPQVHWYIVVVMTRSLLISIAPVIPQSVAQICTLEIVLLASFAMGIHYKPWRLPSLNTMDAILGAVMILFTNIASFSVKDANVAALGWMCLGILGSAIAAMPAFLSYAVWRKVGKGAKPYQFFLCHCKAEAGAFARWVKTELTQSPHVKREVFLDSDNLETLDLLLSYVAADVETLVVIASQTVFYRPWCIGEVTTAFVNSVDAVVLALPEYTRLEEATIATLDAVVPDIEMLCVDYGLRLDTIKAAIERFSRCEAIPLPPAMMGSAMASLEQVLISPDHKGEIKAESQTLADSLQVAIVCDKNFEAVAIAHVLLKLVMPHLCHDAAFMAEVVDPYRGERLSATVTKVVFLCTQGCFDVPGYLDLVLEAGDRDLTTLPVIGDAEFRVPKPEDFDRLRVEVLTPAPNGEERVVSEVVVVVAALFKDIAVAFLAKHERIGVLEIAGLGVAKRLLKRTMRTGVSSKMAMLRPTQDPQGLQDGQTQSRCTSTPSSDLESDEDEAVDAEWASQVTNITNYGGPAMFEDSRRHSASAVSFAASVSTSFCVDQSSSATAAQRRYKAEKRMAKLSEERTK